MGVNCSATLNPKADWKTVGLVASILLGDKPKKETSGNTWWTVSERFGHGIAVPSSMPEYLYIKVQGDPLNPAAKMIAKSDTLPYSMWYGLESKGLYPAATAAKIALTVAITKFFGGKVTLNDFTGKSRTYKAPAYIAAEDGKLWYQLQQALLDLKPLTQKDIDAVAKHAAY